MNHLLKMLEDKLSDGGFEISDSKLLAAPELAREGKGKAFRKDNLLGEYGEYPTQFGSNYYGYAGIQPWQIDRFKIGPAIGAYGPDLTKLNALAGLVATHPINNGEARFMISNDITNNRPAVFFSFDKKF